MGGVVFLLLPAACASLSGLDDGNGADSGHAIDATRDAPVRTDRAVMDATDATAHTDAHPGDASTADARPTADARDAPAPDVSTKRDAEAGSPHDAHFACTPFVVPDAAPAPACPAAEAGSCSPQTLSGFSPSWVPPQTSRACTASQITNLISTCFGASSSESGCQALLTSTADQTCNECMITGSTAPAWGPLVYHATSGYYVPNVGGCIALLAPCQMECAAAYEAKLSCEFAACESVCLSSVAGFNTCTGVAGGCECAPDVAAVVACESALAVGPQAECFFDANNFLEAAQSFGTLFCGGLPSDAGTDGG